MSLSTPNRPTLHRSAKSACIINAHEPLWEIIIRKTKIIKKRIFFFPHMIHSVTPLSMPFFSPIMQRHFSLPVVYALSNGATLSDFIEKGRKKQQKIKRKLKGNWPCGYAPAFSMYIRLRFFRLPEEEREKEKNAWAIVACFQKRRGGGDHNPKWERGHHQTEIIPLPSMTTQRLVRCPSRFPTVCNILRPAPLHQRRAGPHRSIDMY